MAEIEPIAPEDLDAVEDLGRRLVALDFTIYQCAGHSVLCEPRGLASGVFARRDAEARYVGGVLEAFPGMALGLRKAWARIAELEQKEARHAGQRTQ